MDELDVKLAKMFIGSVVIIFLFNSALVMMIKVQKENLLLPKNFTASSGQNFYVK